LRDLTHPFQIFLAQFPVKYVQVLFDPLFVEALHKHAYTLFMYPSKTNLHTRPPVMLASDTTCTYS